MSGRHARTTLQPTVLRWARERAGLAMEAVAATVGVRPDRVVEWERSGRISVAQADRLAHCTHTPVGYLYLREPPEDDLPIPDFRVTAADGPRRPSPDLLETVDLMARRQAWMRDELIEDGAGPLAFVGCCGRDATPAEAAIAMREHLELSSDWGSRQRSWAEALRHLRNRVEASGILVVFNGVVGNDTHRRLDRREFQGLALVDHHAPLIVVNGTDFKAAQMFALAHELAHVFVGATGVSSVDATPLPSHDAERFCNSAAAEFLVSEKELIAHWRQVGTIEDRLQTVAKRFKVSVLVGAHRALGLRLIDEDDFARFYDVYQQQAARRPEETGGGSFWNGQNVRIGRRFGRRCVAPSGKAGCRIARRMPSRACEGTRSRPSSAHWIRRRRDNVCALDANVFIEAGSIGRMPDGFGPIPRRVPHGGGVALVAAGRVRRRAERGGMTVAGGVAATSKAMIRRGVKAER